MERRAYTWLLSLIVILVISLYGLSALIVVGFGLPMDLSFPLAVRGLGFVLILGGGALVAWLLKYRDIRAIVESTHVTWMKLLGRASIEDRIGRTEPLVIVGPHRIVRHPMYTGIGTMALGIALVVDHTFALLGAILLCLWFAFVMAPFEERELKVLFGPAYEQYVRTTPRMIPIPWRRLRRV